jgi:hypothetical protein
MTNVQCGKRKYHDLFNDPDHGDWTRQGEKWQCKLRPHVRPVLEWPFYVDPDTGTKYLGYYEAKHAMLEAMAPVDRHVPPTLERVHGTDRGYHQHINRPDMPACRPCLDAHAVAQRKWRYG